MSAHRAVIEAGPRAIRRLCCGALNCGAAESEMHAAALDCIDDPVALVETRPVPLDSLWRAVFRSVDCEHRKSVVIIHPSWWAPARVDLVANAARALADEVEVRPRSWLLAQAAPLRSAQAVVVEIADRFVVVTGAAVTAEMRRGEPGRVAEAVARAVVSMTPGAGAAVLIDEPADVREAAGLATMIAHAVRVTAAGLALVRVDDRTLRAVAAGLASIEDPTGAAPETARGPARRGRPKLSPISVALVAVVAVAVVVLVSSVLGVGTVDHRHMSATKPTPTTFLVEGRVAFEVPRDWPVRRVVAGPGSARVAITSPSDPEAALYLTQSPVVANTLRAVAESLQRAIDAERPGVFVDFNPSGLSAGRPAVTYREVRAGHDIWWTVLLDRSLRISVGCQSRPENAEAVRAVCERAIRTARALD